MKRKIFGVIFVLTILLCVPLAVNAEIIDSGECGADGNNVTWTLDDTGTLTISGEGEMDDYFPSFSTAPWNDNLLSITKVIIDHGVTSIGYSSFVGCTGLKDITIGSGLTSLGDNTFASCTGLTSVTIPDSVASIGYYAFHGCSGLKSVTIPDSVTSIAYNAFLDCISLENIDIGNSVTSIGHDAFYGTGYYNDDANWTDNVLYIGNYLIKAKDDIRGNYSIQSGTKLIAEEAFENCAGLTSITIPDSVTSINNGAFADCIGLKSLTIPNSVTSIGGRAFADCAGLSDVYYAGSETDWGNINIKFSNNPLLNATIHYNTTAIPTPKTPVIDGISYENGECTFTAEVENIPYTTNLISVLYDQSGAVAGTGLTEIKSTDTSVPVTVEGEGAKTVKVFIWSSLSGMKPLCEASEVQIR